MGRIKPHKLRDLEVGMACHIKHMRSIGVCLVLCVDLYREINYTNAGYVSCSVLTPSGKTLNVKRADIKIFDTGDNDEE
jgi:hypothetical protein